MTTTTTYPKQPFTEAETEAIKADFFRDGFKLIPNILTPEEIAALKAGCDRALDDPSGKNLYSQDDNPIGCFIGVRLFETDRIFEELLTREPIISLAESI